ncbi:MazG-like family protein [Clostridium botulinum D/C]|uniref:MazG-like family protein n=1 Tax=Clostridium botulinum TaxID=1491 RepID=UPI001E48D455|nr:MazG-like family protein [Clostridium botulinum]MCD3351095.1 MazG-like family protein [Clostridium botulinum D/C]MCD3358829.1 MazG-like family protein [Clostridium botulinum D/C]MCD3361382.1 MazG-like family protein [Clostridium botulinum D/C]MCD3365813.1 MazG-like family protein [Clostridium botulinum D/C]
MKNKDFNIMTNIKIIENLKAELLCIIGDFFKLLSRGSNVAHNAILDCISGAIIILYILGDRLGYSYKEIDQTMKEKLKIGISEEDIIEKESKELSNLYKHIKR